MPSNPFDGMDRETYDKHAAHWSKPKAPRAKRGKPEKVNQDRIWQHLVSVYGAVPQRVNSGSWVTNEGYHVQGAKAGTSDLIVLLSVIVDEQIRIGVYLAIETKSMTGKATDAQTVFLQRVHALGGIGIVARTPLDVDTAIHAWCQQRAEAFGVTVRPALRSKA